MTYIRITIKDDRHAIPSVLRVEADTIPEAMRIAAGDIVKRGPVNAVTFEVEAKILREPG